MEKTKILFFASNTPGTKRLAFDEEERTIKERLEASPHSKTLELVEVLAARATNWLDALTAQTFRIVHFSGHGTENGSLQHMGYDGLTRPVSPAALQAVFQNLKGTIKLVFFNACYSKVQAEAIREEIDCVIGMNDEIHDESALVFINTFYRRIFEGKSVEEAFKQGKIAITLNGLEGEQIPELLVRPGVDAAKVYLAGPLSNEESEQISLFYCYAPRDEHFCQELEIHLSGMRRRGIIKGWYAQNMGPGPQLQQIQDALDEARIILLIVSPDFMNHDPLYEHQIKEIERKLEDKTVHVIPIIVRPTDDWEHTAFGGLFALPRDKQPVSAWAQRDEALYSIARDIRQLVEEMKNDSK